MVIPQSTRRDSKLLNALYPTVRRLERIREIPSIIEDGGRVEGSNKGLARMTKTCAKRLV
jgi:hypothetical protein